MLRKVEQFAFFFVSLMELWQDRTWRTFVLQQEYLLRCKELAKAKTENRLDAYIDERRAIVRDRASVSLSIQLDDKSLRNDFSKAKIYICGEAGSKWTKTRNTGKYCPNAKKSKWQPMELQYRPVWLTGVLRSIFKKLSEEGMSCSVVPSSL